MQTHRLFVVAALLLAPAAFAHPGHGTAPASEAGKPPHVHFGAAKPAPSGVAGKLPAQNVKKSATTRVTPASGKVIRRER